jgi:hypothetical protein
VGNFVYPKTSSSKLLSCSEGQQKVTHAGSKAKTTLDFVWQAPVDYKGEVLFRSTFVKDFLTFWVRVPSSNGFVRVGKGRAMYTRNNILFLHAFDRHRAYLFTLFLKCNLFFVGGG